jgi:hypothetical protein
MAQQNMMLALFAFVALCTLVAIVVVKVANAISPWRYERNPYRRFCKVCNNRQEQFWPANHWEFMGPTQKCNCCGCSEDWPYPWTPDDNL